MTDTAIGLTRISLIFIRRDRKKLIRVTMIFLRGEEREGGNGIASGKFFQFRKLSFFKKVFNEISSKYESPFVFLELINCALRD